ncbi:MAG: alpha/beta hydrolase [Epsilonproteobacteria bacterium]|nr:alpha/beta hydrolase [Campylobacterota bacterium]
MAVKLGIHYEMFNLQKDKSIIFLHGWGSNKEVMKVFREYFDEYKLVFIDMPGFGKTPTNEIYTTAKYAQKLDEFLQSLGVDKYCIIGHSFGGKVATLLNPKYLVLLSSAGIINPKPLKVRLKIIAFKALKSIFGGNLKRFFASEDVNKMSDNMYETFKNVVDEDFREYFSQFTNHALVIGATNDTAVTAQNSQQIASLLHTQAIILPGDHYFFLSNPKQTAKLIKDFLSNSPLHT